MIKVLYVDDEPINLKLFQLNFESVFKITTAESGHEGLEVLKNISGFQVVISDMRMPGMNGLEFIRIAKEDFPHITYFVLSGFEITEEVAEALNQKLVKRYFRKPLNYREIEQSIKDLFE